MNIKSQLVNINGEDKNVIVVNYTEETEVKVEETNVERLHHIHILDRSGSMWESIDRLIDNVKNTIDYMEDNDLVSVIWFSGVGQCKALLKGATKSPDLYTLLDTLKSTVGLTCFNESLQLTNEIIDELKALCPNFSVTMFTDGDTVTPHSEKEEKELIFKQLEIMKDNILALNTIGYGWYYNEELLKEMSATSLFGRMIHSENIEEYKDIWSRHYELISNCISGSVKISTSDSRSEILYLTRNNTKLSGNEMAMNYLDKWKNQFFIIAPADLNSITINDVEYLMSDIKKGKIRVETFNNFIYALAYEYYYSGKTDSTLELLMMVRDKNLIDSQLKAFTSNERKEYMEKLSKAIYYNGMRDNSAPVNYIPSEDAFCLMDLIKILASDNNYYVPTNNYSRIGQKVTDGFNLFNKTETLEGRFKDIVLNQKNLNISIMFTLLGNVKLNPRQATKNNLPLEIPSRTYRTHTIIKDGRPNMESIRVRMTTNTYSELANKITMSVVKVEDEATVVNDSILVDINLHSIPVINRLYAKDKNPESLLKIVKELNEAKAVMKVLKEYNKGAVKPENIKEYSEDQLEILKEHGLNSRLEYVGVDNNTSTKEENDFYMTRSLECSLKGWSSLPKVNDVYKKMTEGKKLNAPALVMKEVIEGPCTNADDLNPYIKETSNKILQLSLDLNILKMAKVLTGSWWENLELDSKGNYVYGDLIIKAKYEKKYY